MEVLTYNRHGTIRQRWQIDDAGNIVRWQKERRTRSVDPELAHVRVWDVIAQWYNHHTTPAPKLPTALQKELSDA